MSPTRSRPSGRPPDRTASPSPPFYASCFTRQRHCHQEQGCTKQFVALLVNTTLTSKDCIMAREPYPSLVSPTMKGQGCKEVTEKVNESEEDAQRDPSNIDLSAPRLIHSMKLHEVQKKIDRKKVAPSRRSSLARSTQVVVLVLGLASSSECFLHRWLRRASLRL